MRVRWASIVFLGLCCCGICQASQWAAGVDSYQQGTVATGSGSPLPSDPTRALGAPDPTNGDTILWPCILSPFSPPYENTQVVDFGQGGWLTVRFASPIVPIGTKRIGVFTTAGLMDQSWPNGSTVPKALTTAHDEYSAERSALVEVGSSAGTFVSLGRIVFANPTNYFANAADPYAAIPPSPAQVADFTQPFLGQPSDFGGLDWPGVLAKFAGSAGGTWITLPADLSLSDVQYVRFSQPLWMLDNGSTAIELTSKYQTTFSKPADLFVDAVIATPEPASAGLLAAGALLMLRRRRD